MTAIMIGWTTAPTEEVARDLGMGLLNAGLAVCIHVEGPITAYFKWEGKVEEAEEYRLIVKFASENADKVGEWLEQKHPYDTPQWLAVEASVVGGKYGEWANSLNRSTART